MNAHARALPAREVVDYLPRVLLRQAGSGERVWDEQGTMVFADVSGFTKLSERLARKGKAGAEELVGAISSVFTHLLTESGSFGGDVLKFGGDALLLFFSGDDHLQRACRASHGMRRVLRQAGRIHTSSGDVTLRMSQGIHTGQFHFFLVGGVHQELVVAGPAATETVEMESAADAGEILLSPAAAAGLDERWLGDPKAGGTLLGAAPKATEVADVETAADDAMAVATAAVDSGVDLGAYVPLALRGRLATVVDESEHRQVAVSFMHFGGVDHLLSSAGPLEVHRRLDHLTGAVVEAAAEFGVTVICTDIGPDGGKFMMAAGAPEAYEDSEERMLRAVRQVLDGEYGLKIRAGVNRGHVYAGAVGAPFRFTYSTMGDAVNLAARVMGKAEPGQLLATAAVIERCPGRFETEPLAPFMVKGKSMPVRAFSVGMPVRAGRRRVSDQPFVGRGRELALFEQALADAVEGKGRVIELVAEAGMGKSRLVGELIARAAGLRRLFVECEQYESNTPYFAARLLLRAALGISLEDDAATAGEALLDRVAKLAPELLPWAPLLAMAADASVPSTREVEELAPQFRRARMAEVAEQVVSAALDEPTLFVLEDAFWMDEASSELIAHLAQVAASRPWVVCVSRRPMAGGLHQGVGYDADVVELGPLPDEDAAALVSLATNTVSMPPHFAERLVERSAGNPLFLLELVAAAGAQADLDALPDSVEAIVSSRLDRLAPSDRKLLRYASVLGSRFEGSLVRDALGPLVPEAKDASAWSRLDEFVAGDEGGVFRFRNDLFRRVAYEALPFSRRREVHGRVGEVLERSMTAGGHGEEAFGLLSLHYHHAGRHGASWHYSVAAGDHARGIYANVEAAEFYRRGIEAARSLPGVGAHEVARVNEALGDVCEVAALYDQAAQAYRTVRRMAGDDRETTARLMVKEGKLRERIGKYADAVRWYGRALRASEAVDEEAERARVRARLAVGYAGARYRQGKLRDCVRWAKLAVPDAEAADDRATLAHAYFLLDAALTDLGSAECETYRGLALPIFEEIGDLLGQANVLNNLGIDAYYEGDWEGALDLYERSRVARERAGDVVGAATAANNIGEILSDQGHFTQAEALFRQAGQVFRNANYPVGVALATSNLGRAAGRAGRVEEAIELLSTALDQFRAIRADSFVLETQVRMAELLVMAERYEQALALASAVKGRAGEAGSAVVAMLMRIEGEAAAGLGRLEEARDSLEESLRVGRASMVMYEVGLSLRALAVVMGSMGMAVQAMSHEMEAAGILTPLGVGTARSLLAAGRLAAPGIEVNVEGVRR